MSEELTQHLQWQASFPLLGERKECLGDAQSLSHFGDRPIMPLPKAAKLLPQPLQLHAVDSALLVLRL